MITDTDFIGNTATDSTPLVVSFESGANLDMARVEFIGNTNGLVCSRNHYAVKLSLYFQDFGPANSLFCAFTHLPL